MVKPVDYFIELLINIVNIMEFTPSVDGRPKTGQKGDFTKC